jgi:RNA polymerase sigma factor (sigma-70 family)
MHQKLRRVDRILESTGALDGGASDLEAAVNRSGIVSFKEWESAHKVQQPISLDRRHDPDREGPIEVEDERAVNPIREVYLREIKEYVSGLLDELPPRHQAVLRLRYGLDGDREHTLESIGSRLKISRERVRQIQTEAIERIALMTGLPKPQPPVTRRRAVRPRRAPAQPLGSGRARRRLRTDHRSNRRSMAQARHGRRAG